MAYMSCHIELCKQFSPQLSEFLASITTASLCTWSGLCTTVYNSQFWRVSSSTNQTKPTLHVMGQFKYPHSWWGIKTEYCGERAPEVLPWSGKSLFPPFIFCTFICLLLRIFVSRPHALPVIDGWCASVAGCPLPCAHNKENRSPRVPGKMFQT